jgi:chromosome segregation ATPase
MGERSDEEKRQLKQQITDLEGQLDQVKEKRKMLQTQGRKLQNELAMSRLLRDEQTTQKGKLVERQGELELANRMIEDDYKAETKVKEEMSVQNDLLRLEVRRLRDLLSAKADSVFSLENRRQQLLMSMEERKQEINVHREVLKAEFRTLNDEKHKVTMELRGKEAAVDKLRARFEATSKGSEEEGEGKSQSYYIILAAQRREQLQRQGDELDHAVRKAEREIRALQTTLDHLNARNTAYRASFQKVDLKGDDAEVLKQLEERAKMGKDILFRQKKELQRLTTDFEEDSRRLQQVKSQSVRVVQQKEHLESARRQVCDEILTQQAQLEELKERSDRIINKHRDKVADSMAISVDQLKGGTLEEKMALSEVYKEVVQVR